MQLRTGFQYTSLSEARFGRLLVVQIGHNRLVRGIKGFVQIKEEEKYEYFVSLASVSTDDDNIPTSYEMKNIPDGPALDITDLVELVPSLEPPHISLDGPSWRYCTGELIFFPNSILLEARTQGGPTWQSCYIDLNTGEIKFRLNYDDVTFITRSWKLIEKRCSNTEKVLHSFEAKQSE